MSEYQGVYAIKDRVADDFGPLFVARNESVAVRMFEGVQRQSDCPNDYSLYRIGFFRYFDGKIELFQEVTSNFPCNVIEDLDQGVTNEKE